MLCQRYICFALKKRLVELDQLKKCYILKEIKKRKMYQWNKKVLRFFAFSKTDKSWYTGLSPEVCKWDFHVLQNLNINDSM